MTMFDRLHHQRIQIAECVSECAASCSERVVGTFL